MLGQLRLVARDDEVRELVRGLGLRGLAERRQGSVLERRIRRAVEQQSRGEADDEQDDQDEPLDEAKRADRGFPFGDARLVRSALGLRLTRGGGGGVVRRRGGHEAGSSDGAGDAVLSSPVDPPRRYHTLPLTIVRMIGMVAELPAPSSTVSA